MVKIIPAVPRESFSDKLTRGLNAAAKDFPDQYKKYKKYEDDEAKKKAARTKGLSKTIDTHLKKFRPSILEDEKGYNKLFDLTHKYAESGERQDLALRRALDDVSREPKATKQQGVLKALSSSGRGPEEGGFVGGAAGSLLDALNPMKERPSMRKPEGGPIQAFLGFNKAAAANTAKHGTDIAQHPGKALSELGVGIGNVLAFPVDVLEAGLRSGGFIPQNAEPNLIRKELNRIQEWIREGKSPEEIERSSKREFLGSFIPIGQIFKGLNWLGSKLKGSPPSPSPQAASSIQEAQNAIRSIQKETLTKPLAGRASPGSIEGATASRLERVAPESRLYKPGEQAAIREQQLKLQPQYAAEIEKDAAERIARQEAKSPKTLIGEAGVAKRQAAAQSLLPKAQDSYAKAIARVRALEDEVARGVLPQQAGRTNALLKAAKQELAESEFFLKSTLNNAKTGEARVGIDQMREAARSKVLKIAEDVSEGKEIKLSAKDYNPEIVKQAKALDKKKPLPATRGEDFFTQVHDVYANEYRPRLAQVEKELSDLRGHGNLSNFQRATQLRREKEALQKLIDHIEAENAIHRHKIALREIGQRKLARERLGQFTKQAGEENVKRLAKDALKSPEAAAEAVDAAVNEAASQAPNETMRQRILNEKQSVSQKTQQMASGEGKIGSVLDEIAKGPKDLKNANKWGSKIVQDLQEVFKSLRGEGPTFFNTRLGGDFLIGAGTEFVKELFKEFDIPISHSAALAAALGRPGRGSLYRALISSLTRAGINKFKKERYKTALSQGNDEKLIEFKSSYPAKLRKEATEEYRKSQGSL